MENNFQSPVIAPKRNLPRDVFLHLFAIVTLYWSAISFITLCWQYVNYFFPDALNYNYGLTSSMRFALASLFIVFPLFLLVSWFLNNIYTKESQVRDSKIRKWLIYLTLFITALVIIGDLVFVINTFLGGEITARFILKALSVLFVAVVIFWYYLDDVRHPVPSTKAKYFAFVCGGVILVLVVGAFFIVGSPMKARSAQFDQQRTNDLQGIQYQVVNYWQRKGVLPNTLADLNDSISGYAAPKDPETYASYEYTIKDAANLQFELCATFNLDSKVNNPKSIPVPAMYPGETFQNWNHTPGRVCFERIIDQQLYPPLKNGK
ncbi:MAG: hypothetical protein A2908_04445 [Candidatus Staskawiczbacteria bacterium RIFCSPLOWO2_01_FULL_38_12b]|uniref:DUF5671 domain-containing protein n=1 Tax=Candidatus Staskawiczbacteria bacterium RIFCSPLOWO2_01_FULL_38_12b TaxID=1802214 RepID=A0A1G2IBH9_9BACT|nr:MAG: hypothetical protein A2908_04445 [Candidatus Staskawiczbacteria bacterium RIFCSPLOWO2_01_FULL_38_12b]